jgi:hypothetical protein
MNYDTMVGNVIQQYNMSLVWKQLDWLQQIKH